MKHLKENVLYDHCIVHMDFTENYTCKTVQEIQSAYWNQTNVTLQLIVITTRKLDLKSYITRALLLSQSKSASAAATVLKS